jgi:hypothetical protein
MAGKYYQRIDGVDYDLTALCESKVHDAAPGFGAQFTGEGEFQKAGTNTENITLDGYTVNGTKIATVKKGCYPTMANEKIWESSTYNSAGLIFKRTAETLQVGNSTFYPRDFSCGIIPEEYIIVVVGGGGGGGGNGYTEIKKDVYRLCPGGAGGGGAVVAARIKLPLDSTHYLWVGAGGTAGNNGSSGTISGGKYGADGGSSALIPKTAGPAITAPGGKGGGGGSGAEKSTGTPGTGGYGGDPDKLTSSEPNSVGTYNRAVVKAKGGRGNYFNSHSNTSFAGLSFNPYTGTGSVAYTVSSAKNSNGNNTAAQGGNNNSTTSSDGSYFSGGCSYGYGFCRNYTASKGGGGGSGSFKSAGGSGYIAIYY